MKAFTADKAELLEAVNEERERHNAEWRELDPSRPPLPDVEELDVRTFAVKPWRDRLDRFVLTLPGYVFGMPS